MAARRKRADSLAACWNCRKSRNQNRCGCGVDVGFELDRASFILEWQIRFSRRARRIPHLPSPTLTRCSRLSKKRVFIAHGTKRWMASGDFMRAIHGATGWSLRNLPLRGPECQKRWPELAGRGLSGPEGRNRKILCLSGDGLRRLNARHLPRGARRLRRGWLVRWARTALHQSCAAAHSCLAVERRAWNSLVWKQWTG